MPIHVVEEGQSRHQRAGRWPALIVAGLLLALLLVASVGMAYLTFTTQPVEVGAYRLCGPRCANDGVADVYVNGRSLTLNWQPSGPALVVQGGVQVRAAPASFSSIVLSDWETPLWSWGGYRVYGPSSHPRLVPTGNGRFFVW